jgi:hypothetical protein
MKPLLLIIAMLMTLFIHAQATDSTDIKLQHYKEMFTKGLITSAEYEALKEKLLGIPPKAPQVQQPQEIHIIQEPAQKTIKKISARDLQDLRASGNAGIAGGVFLFIMATGSFIGEGVLVSSGSGTTVVQVFLPIIGVACLAAGGVSLGTGIHKIHKYNKYMESVSLNLYPNRLGLVCTF